MKFTKDKGALSKLMYMLLVTGIFLGLCAPAFGATTNVASSNPKILIGSSGSASKLFIEENAAGALSGGSLKLTLKCPTGVYFNTTTGMTAATTATNPTTSFAISSTPTTSDADGDGNPDKAVWTITNPSTSNPEKVKIEGIELFVKSTASAGDIALSITSEAPKLTGLTEGNVVVAEATSADATAQLSTSAINVAIGGSEVSMSNIEIVEAVAGAVDSGKKITLQLPAGVNFATTTGLIATSTSATLNSTSTTSTASDTNNDGSKDKAVWTVNTKSSTQDTFTIQGIQVTAASSVSAGDINVTINAGTALVDETLKIGTAAKKGITTKAVKSSVSAFSTSTPAITTLPTSPADRVNVELASIHVEENFVDDITANDTLTITLPTGITFGSNPTATSSGAGVSVSAPSDPTGYESYTVNLGDANNNRGGLLIDGIKVNIADSVSAGKITAEITGTINGSALTKKTVEIGEVVAAGVTVTSTNTTTPAAVGIGTNGTITPFEITENNAAALKANSKTITVTLPSGVTWNSAPSASVDPTSGSVSLLSTDASLSSGDSVATFKITTASSAASTITVSGDIALASAVAAGDVNATVAGTAGASGTVKIAEAQQAVTITSSNVPTLTAGVPTQSVADLVLTESFKAALGADGNFRLLSDTGSWAASDPTVSVSPSGAISTTNNTTTAWNASTGTTYTSNDTLVINVPDTASTEKATMTLSKLKLNLSNATSGPVTVSALDGDMNGANGAGINKTDLKMGYVGTPPALTVTPDTVSMAVTSTKDITISGGIEDYTASSDDTSVVTASVSGTTLTLTSAAAGSATVTVSDNAATANTAQIAVTVVKATDVGASAGISAPVQHAADDFLNLKLNLTNDDGVAKADIAQEFLIVTAVVGGQNVGFYFLTDTGGLKAFDPAGSPADFTYAFDPADDVFDIGTFAMKDLLPNIAAGDQFIYGYAYAENASTDFSNLTIENVAIIEIQ